MSGGIYSFMRQSVTCSQAFKVIYDSLGFVESFVVITTFNSVLPGI